MSESTLSVMRTDLIQEVAYYRGWTRAVPTDAGKLATCEADVKAGLKRFYFPPPVGGRIHEWTFLKPETSLSTGLSDVVDTGTSGTTLKCATGPFTSAMVGATVTFAATGNKYTIATYTNATTVVLTEALDAADDDNGDVFTVTGYGVFVLPDAFGSMVDSLIHYSDGQNKGSIKLVGESEIRQKWATDNQIAYPRLGNARFTYGDGTTGSRAELILWPKPDAIYTLYYRYSVLPNALTGSKYPLGGAGHAETIKAACLAEAEIHVDGQPGAWEARFMERLAASIALDFQNVPDRIRSAGPVPVRTNLPLTYNGVSYPG